MELCREDFPADARNFVRVLIANDRAGAASGDPPAVRRAEETSSKAWSKRDPHRLSAGQRADQRPRRGHLARLKRRVQPRVALDKELIGGVRITAGDEVIDGSVRGKLEEMAAALKI